VMKIMVIKGDNQLHIYNIQLWGFIHIHKDLTLSKGRLAEKCIVYDHCQVYDLGY
jgi:hypothetical protein